MSTSNGSSITVLASFCSDRDRKSTRLNSSHSQISYAVFCLKKKNNKSCIVRQYNQGRVYHVIPTACRVPPKVKQELDALLDIHCEVHLLLFARIAYILVFIN